MPKGAPRYKTDGQQNEHTLTFRAGVRNVFKAKKLKKKKNKNNKNMNNELSLN